MVNIVNLVSALQARAKRLGIDGDVTIDGHMLKLGEGYEVNIYFKAENNLIAGVSTRNVSTAVLFLKAYEAGKARGAESCSS